MERQARIRVRNMKKIYNSKKGFTQHHLIGNKRDKDYLVKSVISSRTSGAGFTLIELLVVISIIGMLAGLLMANFVGVRQRARDGARKSDLRQIQSAVEFYRSDVGNYPPPGGAAASSHAFRPCGVSLTDPSTTITYMTIIPCDPQGGVSYNYFSASGATYCLRACLENSNDGERDEIPSKYNANNPSIAGCTLIACSGTTKSFTLQNP